MLLSMGEAVNYITTIIYEIMQIIKGIPGIGFNEMQ
jgi:hypothetical protein